MLGGTVSQQRIVLASHRFRFSECVSGGEGVVTLLVKLSLKKRSICTRKCDYNAISLFYSPSALENTRVNTFSDIIHRRVHNIDLTNVVGSINSSVHNIRVSNISGIIGNNGNIRLSLFGGISDSPFHNIRLDKLSGVSVNVGENLRVTTTGIDSSCVHNVRLNNCGCTSALGNSRVNLFGIYLGRPHNIRVNIVGCDQSAMTRGVKLIGIGPGAHVSCVFCNNSTAGTGLTMEFHGQDACGVLNVKARCFKLSRGFSNTLFCHVNRCFRLSPGFSLDNSLNFCRIRSFRRRSRSGPRQLCSLRTHVGTSCRLNECADTFTSINCKSARCCRNNECHHHTVMRTNLTIHLRHASSFKGISNAGRGRCSVRT